jgi:transglutaminase-like putative cysteine protease
VWGLLTALVLAHMPVGRPSLWRAGRVSAGAAVLGVPIMVLLFLLFPRIGPLWGLPQDAQGRTGLSGSMRLGGVASLAEDDSIALRVRFFGPEPRPEQLYFRGPVLGTFDGREWTRVVPRFPAAQRPRLDLELIGTPLRYEMTIEPSQLALLPLLEMTPDGPETGPHIDGWLLTHRSDGQWQSDRPVYERVRLEASAWLQHRHGPRRDVLGLRDLVDLPPNANPRTLQWAADLRARPDLLGADARALSDAVLQHIRTAGFTYTLEPGPYGQNPGDHAIDEFWFDRKLGFCEHFASAYVVVMRALDVPARIVTGYQGGDPLPQDGYLIVRQRNAHAWAEIWLAGQGWIRVDPTAAVAPERVQRGHSLQPPPGLVAGTMNAIDPAIAARLRAQWELINNRWNQWVLNYSRGQQFDLLKRIGFEAPNWQDLTTTLILLLCAGSLAGAAWAWWDRHRLDPWQRLQQRVMRRLARMGVAVAAHQGPRERARLVRAAWGPGGDAAAARLEDLDRQRYGGTADWQGHRAWWRDFRAATQDLRAR